MPRCWKFPEPSRHFLFSLRIIYKENFDPQKSDERNEGGIFCCGMRGKYILIIVNLQQWNYFNHGGVLPIMSYFLYGLLVFAIMFIPFETVLEPAFSICIWFVKNSDNNSFSLDDFNQYSLLLSLKKIKQTHCGGKKNVLLVVTNIDDVGHIVWWC